MGTLSRRMTWKKGDIEILKESLYLSGVTWHKTLEAARKSCPVDKPLRFVHAASDGRYEVIQLKTTPVQKGQALYIGPLMSTWTKADSKLACAHGWNLFAAHRSGPPRWDVEKIDEEGVFDTDQEVLDGLKEAVKAGDMLARKALLLDGQLVKEEGR